jgi:hypothetical protein
MKIIEVVWFRGYDLVKGDILTWLGIAVFSDWLD